MGEIPQFLKRISRPHHQSDAFPEPGGYRSGKNIPSKGVGGLAQGDAASAVPAAEQVLGVGLAQLLQQGGADVHPKDIPAPGDQFIRNFELVGDKGVLRNPQPLVIEDVVRQAVHPFESEEQPLSRHGRGRVKFCPVPPSIGFVCFGPAGVHPSIQVRGQKTRPGKVNLHVAWHSRGDAGSP